MSPLWSHFPQLCKMGDLYQVLFKNPCSSSHISQYKYISNCQTKIFSVARPMQIRQIFFPLKILKISALNFNNMLKMSYIDKLKVP